MLKTILIGAAVFILACTAFTKPRRRTARVMGVIDGDTFVALEGRRQDTVRLFGIDAPEADQEYGEQAAGELRKMISGKDVVIIPKGKDKYGRTVARVFCGGEDVSLWMLRKGLAWYMEDYCKNKNYRKAYLRARAGGKGLWSSRNPVNPKYFRMQHKKN